MRILQVSAHDASGGAARIAERLWHAYGDMGHTSWMAVGHKTLPATTILEFPSPTVTLWARVWWLLYARLKPYAIQSGTVTRLQRKVSSLARGKTGVMELLGQEYCDHPGSNMLLKLTPDMPDVLHMHNLHGGYFDLRQLPSLSRRLPTLLTLHDEWLFTGHCSCTLGCDRWMTGCGHCPDLTIYPAVERDATAHNWRRKQRIASASELYVATPSQWLMSKVERSMLKCAGARVINNGVDVSIFSPRDKRQARQELGLPADADVVLSLSWQMRSNPFRDHETLEGAQGILGGLEIERGRPVFWLMIGAATGFEQQVGAVHVMTLPTTTDHQRLARFYQSADVFAYASHTDNFPNVILEAMACGTPVVATGVGGIPEQVVDGETGFLVAPRDPSAMAMRVEQLLGDQWMREQVSNACIQRVRQRFGLSNQVQAYLGWYRELLEARRVRNVA